MLSVVWRHGYQVKRKVGKWPVLVAIREFWHHECWEEGMNGKEPCLSSC